MLLVKIFFVIFLFSPFSTWGAIIPKEMKEASPFEVLKVKNKKSLIKSLGKEEVKVGDYLYTNKARSTGFVTVIGEITPLNIKGSSLQIGMGEMSINRNMEGSAEISLSFMHSKVKSNIEFNFIKNKKPHNIIPGFEIGMISENIFSSISSVGLKIGFFTKFCFNPALHLRYCTLIKAGSTIGYVYGGKIEGVLFSFNFPVEIGFRRYF